MRGERRKGLEEEQPRVAPRQTLCSLLKVAIMTLKVAIMAIEEVCRPRAWWPAPLARQGLQTAV